MVIHMVMQIDCKQIMPPNGNLHILLHIVPILCLNKIQVTQNSVYEQSFELSGFVSV